MSLDFFLLFVITFTGGLFYAWLGAGSGVILVPLLPYVSNLPALGAVQASLIMAFFISFINSLVFEFQKLILWSWVFKSLIFVISSAFLAGFCIGFLSPFQIRFILWTFFLLILLFPFILQDLKLKTQDLSKENEYKKSKLSPVIPAEAGILPFLRTLSFLRLLNFLQEYRYSLESRQPEKNKRFQPEPYKIKFFYLCNILAGFSSGLTGVGGGLILSPFFHESRLIPSKNIPAVLAVIFFFVTGFSLLGQIMQSSLNLTQSSSVFLVCLQILPGYLLGSVVGYIVNKKQNKAQLRRQIIRFLVFAFFIKMTIEVSFELLR